MKALYIHADSMEFEAKEKTKVAEEIPDELHKQNMKEVLVAFITVESDDEDVIRDVAEEAVKDILSTKEQVKAERVMLYPYAHLSKDLAKPKVSIEILDIMEDMIVESGTEVVRAPFGWYKSFEIKCKGHPFRNFPGRSPARPPKRRSLRARIHTSYSPPTARRSRSKITRGVPLV